MVPEGRLGAQTRVAAGYWLTKNCAEKTTRGMKLTYVAYSPLDLQTANSIQTFHTCRALAALLGDDLTVIVPQFGGGELRPPFNRVRIPRVPINKLSRVVRSAVWSYLERTAYAWLVALYLRLHPADMLYARDVICAFWLISFGCPVVYEVHDLESRHPSKIKGPRLAELLRRVDERTLGGARAVVSLTQTFKDEIVSSHWQPAERVFVVPDAYDEDVFHPHSREEARAALNLPLDALVVGYAGMTFAYRRLDLLLQALKLWNEPSARALIIGGRPHELRDLKELAKELDLEGDVLWREREPAETTARDLSAADIFVIPDTVTDAAASPLKMFEYMALGRAIVAVDRAALREVLSPDAAEFFRPGDETDFVRALRAVAGSDEYRQSMAARALECAGEYTYARRAEKILAACKSAA
jgi:glycosyltransferase involved in cell wall biosynthesis